MPMSIRYIVARFNKPLKGLVSWQMEPFAGTPLYGTDWQQKVNEYTDPGKILNGQCGAVASFTTSEGETISIITAISLVSMEQARLNLETEMVPFGWNFNAVVEANKTVWNNLMGRVKVSGGTDRYREMFYTNLYRAYAGRTIWSDVNGKYTDMCENERQLANPARNVYGCDALWGAHWNLFPLWTLLTPGVASDWVNSLLELYDQGGWLPQSPTGLEYGEVMVGAHQIKLIVSAYQRVFEISMPKRRILPFVRTKQFLAENTNVLAGLEIKILIRF